MKLNKSKELKSFFTPEEERIFVKILIHDIKDFYSDPDNVKAFKRYQRRKNAKTANQV